MMNIRTQFVVLTLLLCIGSNTYIKSSDQSPRHSFMRGLTTNPALSCLPMLYAQKINQHHRRQQAKSYSISFEQESEDALHLHYEANYTQQEYDESKAFLLRQQALRTKILRHLDQRAEQTFKAMRYIDSKIFTTKQELAAKIMAASIAIQPDGELAQVCRKIKRNMGIPNDVAIRWINPKSFLYKDQQKVIPAAYISIIKTIIIHPAFTAGHMMRILPHEYRHHQQNNSSLQNDTNYEHDADAAMASYISCYQCLQNAAYSTVHTEIQTAQGYFSPQEFQPYIQRAKATGCLCYAHNFPGNFQAQPSLMDYLPE